MTGREQEEERKRCSHSFLIKSKTNHFCRRSSSSSSSTSASSHPSRITCNHRSRNQQSEKSSSGRKHVREKQVWHARRQLNSEMREENPKPEKRKQEKERIRVNQGDTNQ